jgi:hypothetical protein
MGRLKVSLNDGESRTSAGCDHVTAHVNRDPTLFSRAFDCRGETVQDDCDSEVGRGICTASQVQRRSGVHTRNIPR